MLTLFILNEIDKMFSYLSLLFSLCLSRVSLVLASVLSFSCYFGVVSFLFFIVSSWFPLWSLVVSLVSDLARRWKDWKTIGFPMCLDTWLLLERLGASSRLFGVLLARYSTLLHHFVKICVSGVAKIAPRTPKMHQDNQNAPIQTMLGVKPG